MSHEAKEPTPEGARNAMRTMAKLCGLREDFLTDLLFLEQNDWSFIVKAHALLESVVCQLLATHLRQPALEYVLAQKVQMEQRIEMLKAVDITDSTQRQMMRLLGKLRNNLVHNAQQTDFRFGEYFKNRNNRRNFVEAFATTWPDPIPGTTPPLSRADYVLQKPRYAIWMSVIGIVGLTLDAKLKALYDAERKLVLEGLEAAGLPEEPTPSSEGPDAVKH